MALPPPRLTKLQARPRVSRAKQHSRWRRAECDQRTGRGHGSPRPAKGRDRAIRRPRAARPPLRSDVATARGRGVAPASFRAFRQAPSTRAPLRDAPSRRLQPSAAAAGVGLDGERSVKSMRGSSSANRSPPRALLDSCPMSGHGVTFFHRNDGLRAMSHYRSTPIPP